MSLSRQKEYYTRPENTPPPGLSPRELMEWDTMIESTTDKAGFDFGNAILDMVDVMKEELNNSKMFRWLGVKFK